MTTLPDAPAEVTYRPAAPSTPDARVERMLRDEPTAFSFFQAVRLLTRLRTAHAPVGGWADPSTEVVRFAASTSLGFPASEIQTLTLPDENGNGEDETPDQKSEHLNRQSFVDCTVRFICHPVGLVLRPLDHVRRLTAPPGTTFWIAGL